jgi:hypothetical protein
LTQQCGAPALRTEGDFMDVVRNFLTRYEKTREEELSIEEYLDL